MKLIFKILVVVPILTPLHLRNDKSHTRYVGKLNNDNFIMNIKEGKKLAPNS